MFAHSISWDGLADVQKYMSPLVDYVLFNKNIPELPDSSREELEAVYREVQPIRSKEVAERLSPSTVSSYRPWCHGTIGSQGTH
jgi:hypothetical protein